MRDAKECHQERYPNGECDETAPQEATQGALAEVGLPREVVADSDAGRKVAAGIGRTLPRPLGVNHGSSELGNN